MNRYIALVNAYNNNVCQFNVAHRIAVKSRTLRIHLQTARKLWYTTPTHPTHIGICAQYTAAALIVVGARCTPIAGAYVMDN